mmetsp:Transcript_59120/g.127331  ORF Transcript_59120/g.127331 Transcript_59120/m.127331 type:complete len:200 (+) Transcript_59120:912-1511(+)
MPHFQRPEGTPRLVPRTRIAAPARLMLVSGSRMSGCGENGLRPRRSSGARPSSASRQRQRQPGGEQPLQKSGSTRKRYDDSARRPRGWSVSELRSERKPKLIRSAAVVPSPARVSLRCRHVPRAPWIALLPLRSLIFQGALTLLQPSSELVTERRQWSGTLIVSTITDVLNSPRKCFSVARLPLTTCPKQQPRLPLGGG